MKNSLKNKKSIIAARVMLIILLLTSAVSFAGCGNKKPDGYHSYSEYKYVINQEYDTNHSAQVKMYAVSNSDTFEVDNLKLGLMYGIHTNYVIAGREDNTGKKELIPFYHDDQYGEYTFAIYICDIENEHSVEEYTVANISDIPGHQLLKTIPEGEAFSEDYGYAFDNSLPFIRITYFKHVEEIIVPSYFINNDSEAFVIKIIGFCENLLNSEQRVIYVERIVCNYKNLDENTIRIIFD